eukprot:3629932-Karenia_brevis.AAC.1
MAIFTGALWPGDRLEPGDERYKCPFCQLEGYDETHLFYTCPTLATNRHPMVAKTQHLVEVARRGNYNPPCYYLRELQPKANTTPTEEPQWCACGLGAGADLSQCVGE